MDYQRKHPRFEVDTPAAISILGGEEGSIEGRVGDVSEGGFKLILPVPVAIGETLRVEISEDVFVGVVRQSEEYSAVETAAGLELLHWIERDKLKALIDEWTVKAF